MANEHEGSSAEQKRQSARNRKPSPEGSGGKAGYDKKLDGPNRPSI